MRIKMNITLYFLMSFLFCYTQTAQGLEIDEKLTFRVLKVSKSKKTVLVNRGLEDGLVVSDHAKFFLTSGVVARGIVVKASPTRTIWSIYRLIHPGKLIKNKILNLKITSPVKVTDDPTRMLDKETSVSYDHDSEIEGGNLELPADLSQDDKEELGSLTDGIPVVSSTTKTRHFNKRNWELYGLMHFTNMSVNSDRGSAGTSSTTQGNTDLSIGVERYFSNRNSWLHAFSIDAFIQYSSQNISDLDGDIVKTGALLFGAGVKYHFWASPYSYNKVIGFISGSVAIGTSTDNFTIDRQTSLQLSENRSGSANAFSIGAGLKYYTSWGLGGRIVVDYYKRGESYTIDSTTDPEYIKTIAGPRILLGISYRL